MTSDEPVVARGAPGGRRPTPAAFRVLGRPGAQWAASSMDTLRADLSAMFAQRVDEEIDIEWVGPQSLLLGTDFFRRMLRIVDELRPPPIRVHHAFVTGGAGVDEEWGALFAEHRVVVRIGLDGPRRLHDTDRVPQEGWSSFDDAVAAVELLRRHDVDIDLRCSVRPANVGSPLTVYRFLCSRSDAPNLEFVPQVVGTGTPAGRGSVDPHRWGAFLIAVFDHWVSHDVGEVVVRNFDAALDAWASGAATAAPTSPAVEDRTAYLEAGERAFATHVDAPMRTMARLRAEGRFPEEIMTLHER